MKSIHLFVNLKNSLLEKEILERGRKRACFVEEQLAQKKQKVWKGMERSTR